MLEDTSCRAVRRTLAFVLLLYIAWIGAWILHRTLEPRIGWIATDAGRFAYWQVMKFLVWVLPAVALVRASGQGLRDVIGLNRVRSILLWGGGIGLVFVASALITQAAGNKPLFSPKLTRALVGGVIVAPIVEEITFRGAVLAGLLRRYRFVAANTLTALFFLGIHLPGWYFQGRPSTRLNAEGRKMKSSRIVIPLALLACTWGCEPTPYQRAVPTSARGYSDKRLSEDTFHVEFTANYTTSADVMHEYLHRRAAELTLRHGFRYFAVIREPRPLAEYEIKYRSREDEQAGIDGKDVEMPAWGTLQMTIQCFKDPQSASGVRLIDARAYLRKTP